MKTTFLPLALAAVLALALTACNTNTPPQDSLAPVVSPTAPGPTSPAPDPTPTTSAPQNAIPIWSDQSFSRTFVAGDGTEVMTAAYTLPLVQNTEDCTAGVAINAWYKAEGATLLLNAEENYELAVADYEVSTASGLPFQPIREEMTWQTTVDEGLISIRREYYVNSGATPMVFRFSEQFDALTGTQLFLSDFFSDPESALTRVKQALLAQEDIAPAIASGALTATQVESVLHPEQFYLTEDGYVFWVQGGDLPATHTYIEVTVPFDTLQDLSRGFIPLPGNTR